MFKKMIHRIVDARINEALKSINKQFEGIEDYHKNCAKERKDAAEEYVAFYHIHSAQVEAYLRGFNEILEKKL